MSIPEPPALPALRIVAHDFAARDFIGGDLAIDFANTAAGLNRDPRDWLDGFDRLVSWARLAGAWDQGTLDALGALANNDAHAAGRALARARKLRTAIYELLHCLRIGRCPLQHALDELARWCARSAAVAELRACDDRVDRRLNADRAGLDLIAFTIAEAAMMLFTAPGADRLRICEGRNCGWLFIDSSSAGHRRWCDMKTCGNAAKAQRHYARNAQKRSPA